MNITERFKTINWPLLLAYTLILISIISLAYSFNRLNNKLSLRNELIQAYEENRKVYTESDSLKTIRIKELQEENEILRTYIRRN